VDNDDWEAMTVDLYGKFYIADIGDNELERKWYRIHQFSEPEMSTDEIEKIRSYKFKYADGEHHDCEAVFAMTDKLYLITKEQKAKQKIFCIDRLKKRSSFTMLRKSLICSTHLHTLLEFNLINVKHFAMMEIILWSQTSRERSGGIR